MNNPETIEAIEKLKSLKKALAELSDPVLNQCLVAVNSKITDYKSFNRVGTEKEEQHNSTYLRATIMDSLYEDAEETYIQSASMLGSDMAATAQIAIKIIKVLDQLNKGGEENGE